MPIMIPYIAVCDGGECVPQRRLEFEGAPGVEDLPHGWKWVRVNSKAAPVLCCAGCTKSKAAKGQEVMVPTPPTTAADRARASGAV